MKGRKISENLVCFKSFRSNFFIEIIEKFEKSTVRCGTKMRTKWTV